MYQCAYYSYKKRKFFLRDSEKGWFDFDYYPTYYKIDKNGEYETLDGLRATPVSKCDKTKPLEYYEIDIPMETRVLIDLYKDDDEVPKWQNIVFFDIEIEIGGALTPEYIKEAPMPLTSIALYDQTTKTKYCYIIDKDKQLNKVEKNGTQIIPCTSEKELIKLVLDKWEELDPTIITGWNSGYFDIPYMYYRICNLFGEEEASRLSPLGEIKFNDYDPEQPVVLCGLNHLDYMLLFKKFITKQEPSYKLGDIGEKYVKLGKIEYEDGNLDKLFREDIDKFIEYNIRDVDILIELDKKMQFIGLSQTICHLCHVPYEQIYYATVLNEGAILTYLKRINIVSPNKPTTVNPALKENIQSVKKAFKTIKKKIKKLNLEGIINNYDFRNGCKYYDLTAKIEDKLLIAYNKNKDFVFQIYIDADEVVLEFADEYAGGYLLDPIPGLYSWLIDDDYSSLYPSIIRSLNLGIETYVGRIMDRNDKEDCWWGFSDLKEMDPDKILTLENKKKKQTDLTVKELIRIIEESNLTISPSGALFKTDIDSIAAKVLADWFTKRKSVKKLMEKAFEDGNVELGEHYNRMQHSLKILLNSLYGCYAINGWRYTDGRKILSSAITLAGQRFIKESIKEANKIMEEMLKK